MIDSLLTMFTEKRSMEVKIERASFLMSIKTKIKLVSPIVAVYDNLPHLELKFLFSSIMFCRVRV